MSDVPIFLIEANSSEGSLYIKMIYKQLKGAFLELECRWILCYYFISDTTVKSSGSR